MRAGVQLRGDGDEEVTCRAHGRFLLGLLPVLLLGCSVAGSVGSLPRRIGYDNRWIVVEKRVDELPLAGFWPEGMVRPESTVLTVVAVRENGATWTPTIRAADYFVEILNVDPKGQMGVGQVVNVSVRVGNAKPDAVYRLAARPKDKGTRVIGPIEQVAAGREEILFRFTRVEGGDGIVAVEVKALQ